MLQPSKRLTAVEVLASLSTIVSTFRIPAVIGEEEDQVVPDIDVSDGEEDGAKKSEKKEEDLSHETAMSDFSKQITIQVRRVVSLFSPPKAI